MAAPLTRADIIYNTQNTNTVYVLFVSKEGISLTEIKTVRIALGLFALISSLFLPMILSLAALAGGVALLFFSVKNIGDLKALKEFGKIDYMQSYQTNGWTGLFDAARKTMRAYYLSYNEAQEHVSSAAECFMFGDKTIGFQELGSKWFEMFSDIVTGIQL